MKDIMVDLETLGVTPGCVILSIGAVAFDPRTDEPGSKLGGKFYSVVSRVSCVGYGLSEDLATRQWWDGQSDKAKQVLVAAESANAPTLVDALAGFTDFVRSHGQPRIWGNGADFDNPILSVAYRETDQETPWKPWNGRCYRTLKNLVKGPKLERVGTYHNALDDAISQANHACALFKVLRGES